MLMTLVNGFLSTVMRSAVGIVKVKISTNVPIESLNSNRSIILNGRYRERVAPSKKEPTHRFYLRFYAIKGILVKSRVFDVPDHRQGTICNVVCHRQLAFDCSSLRRINPYASVVTPGHLASDTLPGVRNTHQIANSSSENFNKLMDLGSHCGVQVLPMLNIKSRRQGAMSMSEMILDRGLWEEKGK